MTEEFEKALCDYTGAPYVVAVDNQSNALFLSLYYEKNIKGLDFNKITIPSRTYPSVPCEIIHAGFKVDFKPVKGKKLKGSYQLEPSKVISDGKISPNYVDRIKNNINFCNG